MRSSGGSMHPHGNPNPYLPWVLSAQRHCKHSNVQIPNLWLCSGKYYTYSLVLSNQEPLFLKKCKVLYPKQNINKQKLDNKNKDTHDLKIVFTSFLSHFCTVLLLLDVSKTGCAGHSLPSVFMGSTSMGSVNLRAKILKTKNYARKTRHGGTQVQSQHWARGGWWEFKVILSYIMNPMPACTKLDLSQKIKKFYLY